MRTLHVDTCTYGVPYMEWPSFLLLYPGIHWLHQWESIRARKLLAVVQHVSTYHCTLHTFPVWPYQIRLQSKLA